MLVLYVHSSMGLAFEATPHISSPVISMYSRYMQIDTVHTHIYIELPALGSLNS